MRKDVEGERSRHGPRRPARGSVIFAEEEVGSSILVLVAREVGLDDHQLGEAEGFELKRKEERTLMKNVGEALRKKSTTHN